MTKLRRREAITPRAAMKAICKCPDRRIIVIATIDHGRGSEIGTL
jgi:hypothetical protein